MVPVKCRDCKATGMVWDSGWWHLVDFDTQFSYSLCHGCADKATDVKTIAEVVYNDNVNVSGGFSANHGNFYKALSETTAFAVEEKIRQFKADLAIRIEESTRHLRVVRAAQDVARAAKLKRPTGFDPGSDDQAVVTVHPIQKEFGFTVPENGSEERYKERRQKYNVPWTRHTFLWFVHNAIAHPLIAVLPFKPFFKFHDYTSRRMHGNKD